MWKSVATVSLAFSLVSPTLAGAQAAPAVKKPVTVQAVDALNGVWGLHPGFRSNHAKGVVLEGEFAPSPSAASVTTAVHLQKQERPIPVTVRFSDSSGLPDIPDTAPNASPHGMAIKFHLPSGSTTDIVCISYNGFPVATGADFRDMFLAIAASGPNVPKPTPLDLFLGAHPAAVAFLTAPKPAPVNFTTVSYFGVNAFKFTNAKGEVTYGRYQIRPVGGEKVLTAEEAAKAGPDYLAGATQDVVRRGPARFKLMLQVAEPGDTTDNPTAVWPDTRKTVELGTITISKVVEDSAAAERKLVFLPGSLVTGIEAADPMIGIRSGAYTISLARRSAPQ